MSVLIIQLSHLLLNEHEPATGRYFPDQKVKIHGLFHHGSSSSVTITTTTTTTGKVCFLEQVMNAHHSHPEGIQGGSSEGLSIDVASSGSGY
jgi:hypothetical protein